MDYSESIFLASERYKNHIIEMADEFNVKFSNLEDIIDQEQRIYYSPRGPHLSKIGYSKVAKKLFKDYKLNN